MINTSNYFYNNKLKNGQKSQTFIFKRTMLTLIPGFTKFFGGRTLPSFASVIHKPIFLGKELCIEEYATLAPKQDFFVAKLSFTAAGEVEIQNDATASAFLTLHRENTQNKNNIEHYYICSENPAGGLRVHGIATKSFRMRKYDAFTRQYYFVQNYVFIPSKLLDNRSHQIGQSITKHIECEIPSNIAYDPKYFKIVKDPNKTSVVQTPAVKESLTKMIPDSSTVLPD